ncbi:MAG: hypothetical protein H9W81_07545 [Enterococcus sp.]|nr:hypothetical protein [Enterococcus sp.]
MKNATKILTTLMFTGALALTGLMPANATIQIAPEDHESSGTPWLQPDYAGTPTMEDLQVASEQYQARDGFLLSGATGMNTYEVLNLEVPAEGVAADLSNGTCPGPIRYTDTTIPNQEFIAELGECGGWERYGWLQEGNVVRLSGKVEGNYMVADVLALGDPNNSKLHFTDVPDAVLMVNNAYEKNELYLFGLIDYTKRVDNVPIP